MNGAEPHASFYEAIGRALTAWSGVEACLTSLFQACFDVVFASSDSLARSGFSGKVLDEADGVTLRVKIVHEALSGTLTAAGLDDEYREIAQLLFDRWNQLRKVLINDWYKRRNRLAHWSVYVTWDDVLCRAKPILVPHENSHRRHEMLKAENYLHDEEYVLECRRMFDDGREALDTLAREIVGHHFGLLHQLENMRNAASLWGVNVDDLCDYLRRPPEVDQAEEA